MTPKEKAEQLVGKMASPENIYQGQMLAKQCALTAVDEILWEILKYSDDSQKYVTENSEFWNEVKMEIEKI